MGLVLLFGFRPCVPVGLFPSELLERDIPIPRRVDTDGEWYSRRCAAKWELPGHPPAKWILEQVSRDPTPWLLRIDGLTPSKKTMTLEIYRQLLQQPHGETNAVSQKWIEYKGANDWQVPKDKNVSRLPLSEFVRFAEEIKFSIPWLGFSKTHLPRLLPEESTERPIPGTEDQALEDKGDLPLELQKKLELVTHAYKKFWAKKDLNRRETHSKNPKVSRWLIEHGILKS